MNEVCYIGEINLSNCDKDLAVLYEHSSFYSYS